jgi:hypothetical protein
MNITLDSTIQTELCINTTQPHKTWRQIKRKIMMIKLETYLNQNLLCIYNIININLNFKTQAQLSINIT